MATDTRRKPAGGRSTGAPAPKHPEARHQALLPPRARRPDDLGDPGGRCRSSGRSSPSFKNNTEIFSSPWTLPGAFRIENWSRAWTKAHIGRYFLNSVIVVVACSIFGTMLLGSMAAYVLARYKFCGNRLIYYLFVSGLAFPVFLALVPLFFVVKNLGLLNTYTGLILVYIAYSLPFTVFFLTAFFKTLPTSVAEAAMMDGASHTRLFFRIMLPMARPGLVSVAIFNVIGQWNQYLLPVVLIAGAAGRNGCSPRASPHHHQRRLRGRLVRPVRRAQPRRSCR